MERTGDGSQYAARSPKPVGPRRRRGAGRPARAAPGRHLTVGVADLPPALEPERELDAGLRRTAGLRRIAGRPERIDACAWAERAPILVAGEPAAPRLIDLLATIPTSMPLVMDTKDDDPTVAWRGLAERAA